MEEIYQNSPIAQTARLVLFGPVLVISIFPVAYFVCITTVYSIIHWLVFKKKKHTKELKKGSPMAQTTCPESFGPVLVISVLPVAYFVE